MNWLNIRTERLRAPEFIGSDPVDRATWFCVLAYCCEQENGGVIAGARTWKCRQWQQTCGVALKEVVAAAILLAWRDDDLVVWCYPIEKEIEVRHKRETAKINGQRGGRPPSEKEPTLEPTSVACGNQRPKAEGKGIGMEGNVPPKAPTATASPSQGVREGSGSGNVPTTEQSKRLATIFHRKLTTPWTPKEVAAYKKVGTVETEDMGALEAYYSRFWPPNRDTNILRHDLITFLGHIAGEIDRAHAWKKNPDINTKNGTSANQPNTRNVGHNAGVSYAVRPKRPAPADPAQTGNPV